MRSFHVQGDSFGELGELPRTLPDAGFLWLGVERRDFEAHIAEMQDALQRWGTGPLVDLHVSDLLNRQLPSHYDYTSWYDLLVFRRLAAGAGSDAALTSAVGTSPARALEAVDTSAVGFAVFDRVLITVHPSDWWDPLESTCRHASLSIL